MPTLFNDIFDDFLETEISSINISNYSPPYLSNYLTKILKRSREEFYNMVFPNNGNILNKMDDIVDFYSEEYSFAVSTIPSEDFILTPIPETDSIFYVVVDDVETTDYVYDNIDTITINGLVDIGSVVDVIVYKNGQFNQTLTLIESSILIDWMGVIFMKDKIKEQKLYNQSIHGREEGMFSQANQLLALQKLYKDIRYDTEKKTLEYTFRNDPDKLIGFGKRGG
jgi:hypothetical protein